MFMIMVGYNREYSACQACIITNRESHWESDVIKAAAALEKKLGE